VTDLDAWICPRRRRTASDLGVNRTGDRTCTSDRMAGERVLATSFLALIRQRPAGVRSTGL
jgi:hypothetical protein